MGHIHWSWVQIQPIILPVEERRASWICSAHINISVATSLTVLARLLDGKLSYIKAKWVTMSGVQTPTKTLAKFLKLVLNLVLAAIGQYDIFFRMCV